MFITLEAAGTQRSGGLGEWTWTRTVSRNSIILELLPGHAHYNEVRRDPLYINLKNVNNEPLSTYAMRGYLT